jgi:uncharacterized membrane protein
MEVEGAARPTHLASLASLLNSESQDSSFKSMTAITRHISRAFIAGVIALLPIGGLVFTIIWMETTISDSWLADQLWYFPGMGIIIVAAIIYGIGVTVSSFLGRWFWRSLDRLIERVPALGMLYRTLKQIVGYGEGKEGMFMGVVLVPARDRGDGAVEIGLITGEATAASGPRRLTVFIPAAPMPTAGRLIELDESAVKRINAPVSDALKHLVSIGKTGMGS